MLLRFTVDNMLCFNAESSISMIATSDGLHSDHVVTPKGRRRNSALRVAAIYGANGHGKSNFVNAVAALRSLVIENKWAIRTFKLDSSAANRPSKLIAEFRFEGFDYEYGVAMVKKVVAEEWLIRTDKGGREHVLFERTSKSHGDGYRTIIQPGPLLGKSKSPAADISMKTYLDVFSAGMKSNVTFLSEAFERDIDIIAPAYNWFHKILTPIQATSNYGPLFERTESEDDFRSFLEEFMRQCDVGIEGIKSDILQLDSNLSKKLPKDIASRIGNLEEDEVLHIGGADGHSMTIDHDEDGNVIIRELSAVRKNNSGEMVRFAFDEESSGTRRLLDLAPMLADNDDERVYVVDELDRKLHPMLAYKLVEAFLTTTNNQLIFTTHNTFLMSLNLLRRDEIWFVQKRKDGSSDLYSLADMKVRPDLNVRKGYLNGRFGAIPFLGNAEDLGWVEPETVA